MLYEVITDQLVIGVLIYKAQIGGIQQAVCFGQINHVPIKAGQELIF